MLWLKPGDKVFTAIPVFDLTKPDKGVHLVAVTPDILVHFLDPAQQWIGLVFHDARMPLQPPQKLIKQSETFRIRVQHRIARQLHETLACSRRCRGDRSKRQLVCSHARKQIAAGARLTPTDLFGRYTALNERARSFAPFVEIIRPAQRNAIVR